MLISMVKEPAEEVLAREKEFILAEANPRKRTGLLAAAVNIASRYTWEFFKEEMRNASSILEEERQKVLQAGFKEGREQSLQQCLQQGLKQGLLKRLSQVKKEETLKIPKRVILT